MGLMRQSLAEEKKYLGVFNDLKIIKIRKEDLIFNSAKKLDLIKVKFFFFKL